MRDNESQKEAWNFVYSFSCASVQSVCVWMCVCVRVRACETVLHFNGAVTLVGGNRLNALSVGGWWRSAFMVLYSRMLEYPLSFSLSREMWGHYLHIENDRLFTIHDSALIRFSACKTAKFIRTFYRKIRVFWDVSPCRLVDGYLMVCCGNLPPYTQYNAHHRGTEPIWIKEE